MDTPPTLPIKIKHNDNSDKGFVKLKLCRYPTPEKPDQYEFKIALFENGKTEEFLLFGRNFNMTIVASANLESAAKVQ